MMLYIEKMIILVNTTKMITNKRCHWLTVVISTLLSPIYERPVQTYFISFDINPGVP